MLWGGMSGALRATDGALARFSGAGRCLALVALLVAIGAGGAGRASAQQLLVDETFRGASVSSPDWRVGGRGFTTCLTASQNLAQVPIGGCPPGQFGLPAGGDAPGAGALRFTSRNTNQSGFLLWEAPLPLSNGVTATFDYFSYGGTGADGLSFFLVDGAATLTAPGASGGSLGYAQKVGTGATDAPGVANGFAGIGLDEFGNFANDAEGRGTGCANRPPRTSRPDTVSVRGPGNGSTGYCLLPDDPPFPDPTFPYASRRITFGGGLDDPSAPNRNAGTVRNRVQVTVNPTTRRIAVSLDVSDGAGLRPIIDSPLPPNPPSTFKFGFAASTGGQTNVHEIQNLSITTIDDLPRLTLAKQHSPEPFLAGATDNGYALRARVQGGAGNGPAKAPITLTDPLPAGVTVRAVPTGTGWDCSATTVGSSRVSCVFAASPASPVAPGTTLPTLNVPVDVSPQAPGTLTNTATVDVPGNQNTSAQSSATDTATVRVPRITVTKQAAPGQVRPGDLVTFTIRVRNTGDVALTGVRTSDPSLTACESALGSLAPGEAASYTCTGRAGADDETNTVTAAGTPPSGPPVTDSASARVDVVHPAITVTKTADRSRVREGEPVTFTIEVTNTGDVVLDPVRIDDADAQSCPRTLGRLDPGQATAYQCVVTAGSSDVRNTATAVGTPPVGPPVQADASASVGLDKPALTVAKRLTGGPQFREGDPVGFEITVRNSGNTVLDAVSTTDPAFPSCDRADLGPLAPGEARTYSCTGTAPAQDTVNTSAASGQPPTGERVSGASEPVLVDVVHPAITVTKTTAASGVRAGDPVTFTIIVTNSGDVDLRDVAVDDPGFAGCDRTVGTLAAGASTSYACTVTAPADAFANGVTATGAPPVGPPVEDRATVTVAVDKPAIEVSKAAAPAGAVRPFDPVTFTITVRNTGNVALDPVEVDDPATPACDRAGLGPLAPGAETTYTCTVPAPLASVDNVAVAQGQPPTGAPISATGAARVDVVRPAIAITKQPAAPAIRFGQSAAWTIQVRNTGDVALSGVAVADAVAPDCARADLGTLEPGAATTYTCTLAAPGDDVVNLATATGTPTRGPGAPVTDAAVSTVDVQTPTISLGKSVEPALVTSGGSATFTLTIVNTGDVALTGVTLSDPATPACARSLGTLAVGARVEVRCTATNLTSSLTNTATVTGTPPVGATVSAEASAAVAVRAAPAVVRTAPAAARAPGRLRLLKHASRPSVRPGAAVTYAITVRNAGATTLKRVKVCDLLPAALRLTARSPGAKVRGRRVCWTLSSLRAGAHRRLLLRALAPRRKRSSTVVNRAVASARGVRSARARAAVRVAAVRPRFTG